MRGWILYKKSAHELTKDDHGVQRLLSVALMHGIVLDVYRPEQFDVLVEKDTQQTILIDKIRCPLPDFVISRIGAESSYLAIAIIRQLEQQGVVVCNPSHAILAVQDKLYVSQQLQRHGLPTPKTLFVKHPVSIEMVQHELGFPVVIKMIAGARGLGVHLCETAAALKDLMELMSMHQSAHGLILQEFIKSSYGCDLRVFVLGSRVIGCMKRISVDGFKANYSLGGRVEPFPITSGIESLAQASAKLFDLEIAGIDLLFTPDGFSVCEANSSPGFKGMEHATNTDVAVQIIEYVKAKCMRSIGKTADH